MRYFKLLTDNSQWLAGDSIFPEKLVMLMLAKLPSHEAKEQRFEEVSEEFVSKNQYCLVHRSDFGSNWGEKNIFHDHLGREWHN